MDDGVGIDCGSEGWAGWSGEEGEIGTTVKA